MKTGGLKMAREKFLGLKLTLSENNQLEKESATLELTKTDYVKLLMKKGRDHLNDDYRNLQLKKMTVELDILKQQMAGIVTTFNVFVAEIDKREKVTKELMYETMMASFEVRAITRKIGANIENVGAEDVKRSIDFIKEYFRNTLYSKFFGGEK